MQVQISRNVPLDYLDQMGEKADLQSYCEYFVRNFIEEEDYFVIESNLYFKRYNLNSDESEWQGWKITVRDKFHDYIFIMLRRSYIPPLLDTFSDIAIIVKGPMSTKHDHRNTEFPSSLET